MHIDMQIEETKLERIAYLIAAIAGIISPPVGSRVKGYA